MSRQIVRIQLGLVFEAEVSTSDRTQEIKLVPTDEGMLDWHGLQHKVFCQTTGFGGATQHVNLTNWAEKIEAHETSGESRGDVPREMLPTSVVICIGCGYGNGDVSYYDKQYYVDDKTQQSTNDRIYSALPYLCL